LRVPHPVQVLGDLGHAPAGAGEDPLLFLGAGPGPRGQRAVQVQEELVDVGPAAAVLSLLLTLPGPVPRPVGTEHDALRHGGLLFASSGGDRGSGQPLQDLVLVVIRVDARAVVAPDRVGPVAPEPRPVRHARVLRFRVVAGRLERLGGGPMEPRGGPDVHEALYRAPGAVAHEARIARRVAAGTQGTGPDLGDAIVGPGAGGGAVDE